MFVKYCTIVHVHGLLGIECIGHGLVGICYFVLLSLNACLKGVFVCVCEILMSFDCEIMNVFLCCGFRCWC